MKGIFDRPRLRDRSFAIARNTTTPRSSLPAAYLALGGSQGTVRALCNEAAAGAGLGRAQLVATFEVNPDTLEIQLTPVGSFVAVDGRPVGMVYLDADGKQRKVEAKSWFIDATVAARVIARAAGRTNPFLIDYEHQTHKAEANGQAAPAAGFFSTLVWREGAGLFGSGVEWTPRAIAYIRGGEYRYISTVFDFDPVTGEVWAISDAALTNRPAIHGMAAVQATETHPPKGDSSVLQKLIALLGLAVTATEEQALAALSELKGKFDSATAELNTASAELAELKAKSASSVPLEAVAKLQEEIASLKTKEIEREVDQLVSTALTEGKLPTALADWARSEGKRNLAMLKEYIAKAPAIPALAGMQTAGKTPKTAAEVQLSEADHTIIKSFGLDPEKYKAEKAQQEN